MWLSPFFLFLFGCYYFSFYLCSSHLKKKLISATTQNLEIELRNAINPFVIHYQLCPVGFSETDNLNDINECQQIIDELMGLFRISDLDEQKRIVNTEVERFKNGKNAGVYGRYFGRLNYLKNKGV